MHRSQVMARVRWTKPMARGDFYILCPDNDVTRATDEKRIAWAADDLILNRPALSRWHPDHADSFAAYMRQDGAHP